MDGSLITSILGLIRFLFWIVFAMTAADTVRMRDRTRLEIAIVFGLTAVVVTSITTQGQATMIDWDLPAAFALGLHPYLFLRLAGHMRRVPVWVDRTVLVGSAAAAIALPLNADAIPAYLTVAFLAFFIAAEIYAGFLFLRMAVTAQGVTRWRSLLVAIGAGALGITIVMVGVNSLFPGLQPLLEIPALLLVTIAPLAFYLGIAAPRWIRQIWRRAELGRFLSELPSRSDHDGLDRITAYLREAAVRAVGGLQASVTRWDRETQQHLLTPFTPRPPGRPRPDGIPQIPLDLDWISMFAVPAGRFDSNTGIDPNAVLVLVVPIAHDNWLWGHLLVTMASAPLFVLDDLELLALMAGQASRFFRYESLSEDQDALIRTAHQLGNRTDPAELLDEICIRTRAALRVPFAMVTVFDEARHAAAFSAREDLEEGFRRLLENFPPRPLERSETPRNRVRVTEDVQAGLDLDLQVRELFTALDVHTTAVADLAHESRLVGRLKIAAVGPPRRFFEEELDLLQGIAAQAALAVRNAQLLSSAQQEIKERERIEEALREEQTSLERKVVERTAELREQSIRDPMTGVYNRRYLQERLEAEIETADTIGTSLGVIMVDIDDFKRFNDGHGHTAGDELLQWTADALQSRLRKEDIICRFGGDEFILILLGASLADSARRARSLHRELTVTLQGRGLDVTVSMGVAAYPPEVEEGKDVVTRADDALYHAKQTGKNRIVSEHDL